MAQKRKITEENHHARVITNVNKEHNQNFEFKRPKVPLKMGWIRRSIAYPETIYDIVLKKLDFLKTELGEFIQTALLASLKDHVEWAKRNNHPLIPFVMFWWLYYSLDAFRDMINEIELKANPRTKQSMLFRIERFVSSKISALKTSPFEPRNVTAILTYFYATMNLGANVRHAAFLDKRPSDPARIGEIQKANISPLNLAPSNDFEVIVRVVKHIREMNKEIETYEK